MFDVGSNIDRLFKVKRENIRNLGTKVYKWLIIKYETWIPN